MSLILDGQTRFLLDLLPKKIKFTDSTNYTGQSVNPSDVVGCLTFTGPSGVFYNNTNFAAPDILPASSSFIFKDLPLNGQGNAIQGTYTVDYRVRVANNYTVDIASLNELSIVGVDLTSVFVPGFSFQITNGTSPGTYVTASSVFAGGVTIVTTTASMNAPQSGVSLLYYDYYNKLFTYEYCQSSPSIKIEPTIDCDCSTIISRDLTNYNISVCGTTVQPLSVFRTHTVKAPLDEFGNPVAQDIVSSLATVTVTPIWTRTWTTIIESKIVYILPSGLFVEMEVLGELEYVVDCSEGLCCVYSCMANLRNKYESYLQTNPSRAAEFFPKLFKMTTAWMLYSIAHSCGDFANKAKYLSEIIDIAKSENCDCCNAETLIPIEVIPVCSAVSGGSGNTVVVSSCGNGITVTANTVGTTTNYNVCLDLAILNGNIANYIAANPIALGSLSDVTITSVQAGQTLVYNGTEWVNANLLLDDLGDVTAPSPLANQYLMWNGSAWIPSAAPVTYSKAFLINSFTTPETRNTSGDYTSMDIQLPLAIGNNALSQNGDTIEAEALFTITGGTSTPLCGFSVNGVPFELRYFVMGKGDRQLLSKVTFSRISATSLFYKLEYSQYFNKESATLSSDSIYFGTLAVPDIATTGLVIAPTYFGGPPNGPVTCQYSQYKAFKK